MKWWLMWALMAGSLREAGRVALTASSSTPTRPTSPVSEPALAEIGSCSRPTPLKLFVVGHTDNAGTFEHNVRLAGPRCRGGGGSGQGPGGRRAAPAGLGPGPTSPVASNVNETGKAKNRRVSLVAQ